MATCAESSRDFIRSVFGPRVSVISSPDAEDLCQKNNLTFVEMLKPFCRPTQEGQIRDPQNQLHIVRNSVLHISAPHPNPLPLNMVKKMLNDSVSRCSVPSDQGTMTTAGDVRVNASTPWFEAYRKVFFEHLKPSDHEFLLHNVACVLVVSSNHADPMEGFSILFQRHVELKATSKHPKYMPHPHLFYYRLLLHDVASGDDLKAQKLQQEMISKYGLGQSSVLKINSRSLSSLQDGDYIPDADPWSQYLISTDSSQEEVDCLEVDEDEDQDLLKTYSNPPHISATTNLHQSQNMPPVSSEARLDLIVEDPLASESISDPLNSDPLSEATDPLTRALQDTEDANPSELSATNVHSHTDNTFPGSASLKSTKAVHGQCLTLNDQERIRAFVNDFCNRGLLPFLEKHIRQLSEQVNTKRGFQRALYRVGRNWFGGGSKPSSNQTGISKYQIESAELQMRLLGDLAFLSQNYDLAYTCYHSCKKDFQNDHAWLYYAGSLEMAATSLFMQTVNRRDPHAYFEESVQVYADTCQLPHYATRAVLLATEMMKTRHLYRPAAALFIRMTSEDTDLKSALLLEQAAHCFLKMNPPSTRKFAFHLILAGHRYSKAFQRRHALRTYSQALEFYQEKSWSLAEDHINFSLGHQSFTLKQLEDAYVAFHRLLSHSCSLQQPQQQITHLKEFLYVFKQHLISLGLGSVSATSEVSDGLVPYLSSVEATKDLPVLPIPIVVPQQTRVLLSCAAGFHKQLLYDNDDKDDSDYNFDRVDVGSSLSTEKWKELEHCAVSGCGASDTSETVVDFVSCLQNCFDESTENGSSPMCVVGERVDVEFLLRNPLQVDICLEKLTLLWEHRVDDNQASETLSDSTFPAVATEVVNVFSIEACSTKRLRLSLTPLHVGAVNIVGFAYNLKTNSGEQVADDSDDNDVRLLQRKDRKSSVKRMLNVGVRGKQLVHCRGPRLNRELKEKLSVVYGNDKRLHLKVIPAMPQLEVAFTNFPSSLLCGEVKLVEVKLSNMGKKPMKNLRVVSTCCQYFTFGLLARESVKSDKTKTSAESSEDCLAMTKNDHCHPIALHMPTVIRIPLPNGQLSPRDSVTVPMWIHGGAEPGVQEMDFLFCYQPVEVGGYLRHRVLKHSVRISLTSSVRLNVCAELSVKNIVKIEPQTSVAAQELLLTLDIENISHASREKSMCLELRQVSSMSWLWEVFSLGSQQLLEYVLPKETRMLKFRAAYSTENRSRNALCVSQVRLSDQLKEVDCQLSPCIDFFLSSLAASAIGLSKYESKRVNSVEEDVDGNAMSKRDVSNCYERSEVVEIYHGPRQKLSADEALGLTLLWKGVVVEEGVTSHVFGQSHAAIVGLQTLEEAGMLSRLHDDCLLVQASLKHLSSLCNNFMYKRVVQLPVEITIQNATEEAVEVETSLLPPISSSSQLRKEGSLSFSNISVERDLFSWVGFARCHRTIAGQSSCLLKASVCLARPGLYNLSRLRIRARRMCNGSEFTTQTCVPESIVTITGSNSDKCESSAV